MSCGGDRQITKAQTWREIHFGCCLVGNVCRETLMRWLDGITDSMDNGFGQTLGVGDGQGGLASCGSWGCKELDMTEPLN